MVFDEATSELSSWNCKANQQLKIN